MSGLDTQITISVTPLLRRIGGKMPRDRHQNGRVVLTGKRKDRWTGHYYVYVRDENGHETRRHRSAQLGLKSQVKKWEADRELRRIIAKETGALPGGAQSGVTFGWFVDQRYLPMHEAHWRDSTRETNRRIIMRHIVPAFKDTQLRAIGKFAVQVHLNKLAGKFSFSLVDHVRNFLKSIFEEAIDLDLIERNPARKLKNPETKETKHPVIDFQRVRNLLNALPERPRLILMIGSMAALRPGELFALRWRSFKGDRLEITETVWQGKIRERAKTRKSKAPVALPAALAADIARYRSASADPPDEALMFPSKHGTPMRKENFLRREVQPIADRIKGVGRVNFQMLRRSWATFAPQQGASLKDVQAHLRHSKPDVTAEEYMQPVPETVRTVVNRMYEALMATPVTETIQ